MQPALKMTQKAALLVQLLTTQKEVLLLPVLLKLAILVIKLH